MSQAILQFRTPSTRPRRASAKSAAPRATSRPRRSLPHRGDRVAIPIWTASRPVAPQPLVAPNGQLFWAAADRR